MIEPSVRSCWRTDSRTSTRPRVRRSFQYKHVASEANVTHKHNISLPRATSPPEYGSGFIHSIPRRSYVGGSRPGICHRDRFLLPTKRQRESCDTCLNSTAPTHPVAQNRKVHHQFFLLLSLRDTACEPHRDPAEARCKGPFFFTS